ncbi:MAG: hypothetical protein PVJ41_11525 [Desulfobacterales bacterium]|jgi:hypothetical protein
MKTPYLTTAVFAILLPAFLLMACGDPTITLEGDVACTPPVTVTGTVTNFQNVDLNISATVKCNGNGVAGVYFNGTLPVATGNINHRWGPTNNAGTATTTLDIRNVANVPTSFKVIVKDKDGNVVKEKDITIQ